MATINIMAETFLDRNPSYFPAPCPGCGAEVRYTVASRRLLCPGCAWTATLTPAEAHDFLMARTGCSKLDLAAFLAAIADRPALTPPHTLASGKRVLPAVKGETPWHAFLRLGAQAAINGVRVSHFGASDRIFKVSSQQLDPAGRREDYLVTVGTLTTCTCPYGLHHAGAACAHIAAVYLFLTGDPPAAAPAPVSRQARAAAAYDDLFGAA